MNLDYVGPKLKSATGDRSFYPEFLSCGVLQIKVGLMLCVTIRCYQISNSSSDEIAVC